MPRKLRFARIRRRRDAAEWRLPPRLAAREYGRASQVNRVMSVASWQYAIEKRWIRATPDQQLTAGANSLWLTAKVFRRNLARL